jgi:hypothetical protein
VKTHTLGTQTFAIFDTSEKGGTRLVHFLWGKKDFRITLGRRTASGGALGPAELETASGSEVAVTRLQYLYEFDWFDYVAVADHGLASEKVRFRKEKIQRYVELPKDFYDLAVEIACRELDLKRTDRKRKLAG